MSFVFCYYKLPHAETLNATIKPEFLENNEEKIISSYFTDSGGASLDSHIDFLKDSIKKLEDIDLFNTDISSNSYSVEVCGSQVEISFLYNEKDRLIVSKSKFLKILRLWVVFLKNTPTENYEEEYEF